MPTPSLLRRLLLASVLVPACSDPEPAPPAHDAATDLSADAATDAATDAAPDVVTPQSTAHCTYEALPATANATGTVEAGALRAGAAEDVIALPVGSCLGAYTARARALGGSNAVDARAVPYSAGFLPSVGVEHSPRVRALALSAGGETVVILEGELGASDDSTTVDVAAALGPAFAGKVIYATSHSHSAWGHTISNEILGLGFGRPRVEGRRRLVEVLTATARRALAAMAPARIGVAHDGNFDPMNRVSHDRRGDNDDLPNGRNRKDNDLFVVRVDRMDGTPLAVVPVFGVHGTVLGEDNNLASGDAPGAIEQALEESFGSSVVVMHLQGAAGDVSPGGTGGIDCMGQQPCYNFGRSETVGRYAVEAIRAAWTLAGAAMSDRASLEMVTRAIPLGPDWNTFRVRGGALSYTPWDGEMEPDGRIWADPNDAGVGTTLVSPIDEFNAPFGAGLCGDMRSALPPSAGLPGAYGLAPYRSCSRVEELTPILGPTLDLDFPRNRVACGSTRTLLSSLRINDYLFVTLPGEPVTLLADRVRMGSPVAGDHTVVVGYAQGHIGYILHPEDWLRGGYEPSINLWGPLEGQYIMERALDLARLAMTPQRENAVDDTRIWRPTPPAPMPAPDPAPRAGTVPAAIPATTYFPSMARGAARPTSAQPDATVRRLDLARFVWIGEDPLAGTPRITLQRETAPGSSTFAAVTRHSGRPVQDTDVLLAYTPDPLDHPEMPRTHYWVAEWQAVTPVGAAYPDDLSARPGVALGRYRFHVEGTGYMVDSNPFTVAAAPLSVTATRTGTTLRVTAGYEARTGWRLLDMDVDSNRLVPLRAGAVDVVLTTTGAPRTLRGQLTDMAGALTIPGAADVRSVQVTDRHGNAGAATP